MLCASTTPDEPVISSKSGHIYERRLVEKYVDANGKCPVTGEPLTSEDLIAVKVSKTVKPRPVTATSIPSMLQLFQNEWDALMLETYTLKQHLETVRQELAHALYQHDAACRVIARLIKERDSAKRVTRGHTNEKDLIFQYTNNEYSALANLHGQIPAAAAADSNQASAMEVENSNTLPEAIKDKLTQKSQALSRERKKRAVPAELASEADLDGYSVLSSDTGLHKSSPAGLTSLAFHPALDLIVTGGVDGDVSVFNPQTRRQVAKLEGHSKRVTDVLAHPSEPLLFSSSQDRTVRVWAADNEQYQASHVLRSHSDEVVGISLHATGDYLASASADKSWAFHDIRTGTTLTKTEESAVKAGFSAISFHPDGLILGTGTKDHAVHIWDIKAQANVATFAGHNGPVEGLAFSENGYHLAAAGGDCVKLWDLRNELNNFHNIPLAGDVHSVSYDQSGKYLIVAHGNSVSIFAGKNYVPVKTFTDSSAKVTDAKFGKHALTFATVSLDRSLKLYGK